MHDHYLSLCMRRDHRRAARASQPSVQICDGRSPHTASDRHATARPPPEAWAMVGERGRHLSFVRNATTSSAARTADDLPKEYRLPDLAPSMRSPA